MHDKHFPNETDAYRHARNELLRAEIELRRQVESVAAQRRALPLSGVVPEDYVFDEGPADLADISPAHPVRLHELFAGRDTLVVYNFMYGPKMARPCPMCSSFLDGINANARHIGERVSLAVVARSPVERIRTFARERGWNQLRLVSSENNTFNRDYQGEEADGSQNPIITVFVRRDDRVHHFWSSEMQMIPAEDGQNQRHIDSMWPLWNVLDLTPGGRGADFYPGL